MRRASVLGRPLEGARSNGARWVAGQWLENFAEVEVAAPLELCWDMWQDREAIPTWMPWIKSVEVPPAGLPPSALPCNVCGERGVVTLAHTLVCGGRGVELTGFPAPGPLLHMVPARYLTSGGVGL